MTSKQSKTVEYENEYDYYQKTLANKHGVYVDKGKMGIRPSLRAIKDIYHGMELLASLFKGVARAKRVNVLLRRTADTVSGVQGYLKTRKSYTLENWLTEIEMTLYLFPDREYYEALFIHEYTHHLLEIAECMGGRNQLYRIASLYLADSTLQRHPYINQFSQEIASPIDFQENIVPYLAKEDAYFFDYNELLTRNTEYLVLEYLQKQLPKDDIRYYYVQQELTQRYEKLPLPTLERRRLVHDRLFSLLRV